KHRKAKKSVPKPGSSKASLPPKKPKKIKKIVRHLGIKAAERKKNNKKIAKAPQVIVGGSESSLAPQFRKKNRKAKKSVPKPGSSNASLPPRKPKKNKKKQKKRKILFRHVRTGGDESSTSTGSGTPRKVNIGKKKRIQKHKAGGSGVKKTGGSGVKKTSGSGVKKVGGSADCRSQNCILRG
uniref:H15 domain-containing protein n=1 Tax=Macrostomum lignano TaxID=282301 RepID=A0A1I8ITX3_9PLAT